MRISVRQTAGGLAPGGRPRARYAAKPGTRRVTPSCEGLEGRRLLSTDVVGPVISGVVFIDRNQNGGQDPGEKPVEGGRLELLNAAGAVVGRATTGADGSYVFSTDSGAVPRSITQTLVLPPGFTNITAAPLGPTLARFDPSLGKLVDVKISVEVDVESWLKAENLNGLAGADISGNVSDTYRVEGLGLVASGSASASTGVFHAARYDGTDDYAGPSGVTFAPLVAKGTNSATLTSPSALASFTVGAGRGPVTARATITASAHIDSTSSSTSYDAMTKGSAVVTVTYDYVPTATLSPGRYTVVRLPSGSAPGTESVVVDLTASGSAHNDFAVKPPFRKLSHPQPGAAPAAPTGLRTPPQGAPTVAGPLYRPGS